MPVNTTFQSTSQIHGRPTSISIKISPKHDFVGNWARVFSLIFLQDNVHIISSSYDGTMRKWNCETGLRVGKPWRARGTVYALALSPDGKTIACGMGDGSVQRRDTNGQMMEGIWTGHSKQRVWSLSWSPSGRHLASASDRAILVRQAETGEVQFEVDPIDVNQGLLNVWGNRIAFLRSGDRLAYSPSGDRIASGGNNLSIWDSNTGERLVGPIQGFVSCVVWSLDGSKLYSAGSVACVRDSTSGTELHRFQYDNWRQSRLQAIALSSTNGLLAGVGEFGVIQLWDAEFHRPVARHRVRNLVTLDSVSFSPNGRYLAYSGIPGKITLRMVQDTVSELPVPHSSTNLQNGTPQEAVPESPSSSCLNVDVINPLAQSAVNVDDVRNDPYNNIFFTPSHSSLPLPSPNLSAIRRLRAALSLHRPTNRSRRLTRGLFSRRTPSNSTLHAPARKDKIKPTPKGQSEAGHRNEECDGVNNVTPGPGAVEYSNDKGKQREELISHEQTSTPDDVSSPAELNSGENRALFKSLLRAWKMNGRKTPAKVIQDRSPKVVEVPAARGFQRIVVHKRKRKAKSRTPIPGDRTASVDAGGSSQAGPSLHGDLVHAHTPSQGHAGSSSQPIADYAGQSRPTETSYTDCDSSSDSSIEGPCLKFWDRICYPCGH